MRYLSTGTESTVNVMFKVRLTFCSSFLFDFHPALALIHFLSHHEKDASINSRKEHKVVPIRKNVRFTDLKAIKGEALAYFLSIVT
jgi:hypothetical protein